MNKEEILQEIQKTEEHLANMKKLLDGCDYERWKPKTDGAYWYVDSRGVSCCSHFCPTCKTDTDRYQTFNCFQTREQAETEAEKILVRRQLEDIARRLNKGKKIDWENAHQLKYFIRLNNGLYIDGKWVGRHQGTIYCLDKKFLDKAIEEIGEKRLMKCLRGE